jgi:hypothetical protein
MPDAECDVLRSAGICRDAIPIPVNDAMTTNKRDPPIAAARAQPPMRQVRLSSSHLAPSPCERPGRSRPEATGLTKLALFVAAR